MKDFLLTFIYPLLVSIGAILINNQLEYKKARIVQKEKIRCSVLNIEKKVSSFHMAEQHNCNLAIDISTDIKLLGKEIRFFIENTPFYKKPFSKYKKRKKNYRALLTSFRKAATGANFDMSSFRKQAENATLIKNVSSSADDLNSFIETNF